MDSGHGSGNGKHSGRKLNEKGSDPVKSLKSSDSISSGSSLSDDLFQVDLKVLLGTNAAHDASIGTEGDVKTLLRDDNVEDCNDPLFKLEESVNESAASSISDVSGVTHESVLPSNSLMKSPPKQVMDKNGSYDPNRIPASIFASIPATPMDWSVASNESLFSIRIGNNSFSRDRVSMMSEDPFKSGELYKSGELHKPEELYLSRELQILEEQNRSSELIKIRQASAVAKDMNMKIMDKQRKSVIAGVTDEAEKNVLKVEEPRNSSTKHRTDGSGSRGQSLAFPIKKKKKKCACLSRRCCNCSWAFCFCTWLSITRSCCNCSRCFNCSSCCNCSRAFCSCTRPSCSNCCCRWPSCSSCCCRWPSCSSCCCRWPSCSSCSFRCPSCSSCCFTWPSCSSCSFRCPSCSSCSFKWPSCSSCCCKWPSCSSCCCKWPSCCSKWPSCHCK